MSKAEFLLFCLASLVCSTMQQQTPRPNFNKTDGVVELTDSNFKTLVLNSDNKWLVDFHFSGAKCPNCLRLSELIKEAVPFLKAKKIKVGFVEYFSTGGRKLIEAYRVTGFPYLYLFGTDKQYPVHLPIYAEYTGEEFAKAVELNMDRARPAEGTCGQDSTESQESNIYELTDENFEDVVLKCEEPWLINFYVPDIYVCIQFIPYFKAAAKEFMGKAKFGAFFQGGSKTPGKYGVKALCTVKLFPAGDKSGEPIDYNNGTHSTAVNANLVPWLRKALAADLPAPEINELTSQSVLDSKCTNSDASSCIFVILAKSDKCNADCKSAYLDQVTQIATDMKAENWAWFWTTQGKQPTFEKTFGILYFPGVFAVDLKSKTFSTNRGSTSATRMKEFLQSYAKGITPSKNLTGGGFPAVKA